MIKNLLNQFKFRTEKNSKPTKHLICDDVKTNRLILKKYLNMVGCEVDEADDGIEALIKVKNNFYDIIWMDIKMPKMDGHCCTEILRNKMNYQGIIIGLTGYNDDLTIKKCICIGMNDVVAKPFDKNIIWMHIQQISNSENSENNNLARVSDSPVII